MHAAAAANIINAKSSLSDGLASQSMPPPPPPLLRFDEFNHTASSYNLQAEQFARRNASTSTMEDLDSENADSMSGRNHNHRLAGTIKNSSAKDKSGNKLDFNNICGISMKSSMAKPKDTNIKDNLTTSFNGRVGKLKPAKNVYYIEDHTKDEDHNIFIIDPHTINKHKRYNQMQKSLEDIRMHKLTNMQSCNAARYGNNNEACANDDDDVHIGWNFMDRNYYGSRTLPRDFGVLRNRNVRPSLDNLLDNFYSNGAAAAASGMER